MDNRRADPQRVRRSGPTAGKKSLANCRASNEDSDKEEDELNSKMSVGIEVMSLVNRADNTGGDSPDSAQRLSSPSTRSPHPCLDAEAHHSGAEDSGDHGESTVAVH